VVSQMKVIFWFRVVYWVWLLWRRVKFLLPYFLVRESTLICQLFLWPSLEIMTFFGHFLMVWDVSYRLLYIFCHLFPLSFVSRLLPQRFSA